MTYFLHRDSWLRTILEWILNAFMIVFIPWEAYKEYYFGRSWIHYIQKSYFECIKDEWSSWIESFNVRRVS